jgi:hypothetical protein
MTDDLYLLHLLHDFNIYNFFFDFVNYLFLLILFSFCYRNKFLSKRMFIVLSLCSLGPFFVNFFIMDWWYMPDQAKYFRETQQFREYLLTRTGYASNANYIRFPSIILASMPIPFIETINSIGFINKGMLGILTITLFHKKYIDKYFFYFLNLCPSVFLYSSLSLKDNLVLVYCLLIVVSIIYHRGYLINVILIVLLFYLKPLHSILLFVYFFIYNICFSGKYLDLNIIIAILILVALYFKFDEILEYFDRRRTSFFEEANVIKSSYIGLDFTSFSVIKILLKDLFRFILSPLNLQLNFKLIIQSFENFFLYTYVIYLYLKLYKFDRNKAIFWFLSCLFGLMSYGTLIVSDGTIARYKYSFLIIIIFAIYSELRIIKKLNLKSKIISS